LGRLSYKMPEDFLLKVSALADKTDVIIPKVLEEGGQVVADKVKANLQAELVISILSSFSAPIRTPPHIHTDL
jgi:hypothetical protein